MFGRMSTDRLASMLDALDEYLSIAWPTASASERPLMLALQRQHRALTDEVARRGLRFEPLFVQVEVMRDRHL